MSIPYPPDFQIDYHAEWHEERRRRAREALDPSDVLAEVQSLLLGIAADAQSPLWGNRRDGAMRCNKDRNRLKT
jgi:hypothetical protein